jgi:phosphohistidine phosphatase
MKRLTLWRHAKAETAGLMKPDFKRELSQRGIADTKMMSDIYFEKFGTPDLILCSSARRTRQTCEYFMKATKPDIPVLFENGLYMADATEILEYIREADSTCSDLMLFGHNFGSSQLASSLAADVIEMPTCSFVRLEYSVDSWTGPGTAEGKLLSFERPSTYR